MGPDLKILEDGDETEIGARYVLLHLVLPMLLGFGEGERLIVACLGCGWIGQGCESFGRTEGEGGAGEGGLCANEVCIVG